MRILLVTGRLAEPLVRKYGKGCEVFVTPVSVAAFLTPKLIAHYLEKVNVKGYDLILIPGLVRGSAQEIEEKIGILTFKGPRYAHDLPQVLKAIREGFKLSKEVPADLLFHQDTLKKVEDIKNKTKNKAYIEKALKKPYNFFIGTLPVGFDFPHRILAEIVDAPKLSVSEIVKRAVYYLKSGADIIDIGMVSGKKNLEFIEKIPEIREKLSEEGFSVPISFDSLNEREIEKALDYADLFLSIDESNVERLVTDKPVVLIPTNQKKGYFPKNPAERTKFLERLKEEALNLGYGRVIPDLILEHVPHLARSITAFQLYRERNPNDVLLAGVGNVVELIDADSVGINALLAGVAKELNISLLLTTEVSAKCRGGVKELRRALDMMLFEVPKDLGFDLLILKEKKSEIAEYSVMSPVVEAKEREVKLESIYFRIFTKEGKIWVIAHKGTKQILTISGGEPNAIIDTILEHFQISPRHAFYLGRELERARTAIKLKRSYVQEVELFEDFY
ncbi:dihydropteroate synthase [Palaeococcus pacificus DY20341]|uniref:Dihydropteroate synthase n=1 Tax=Palaeococcus pacificus DY20341 TaxID=1343739 RepID=A0A075LZC0_9EURY|nr:dihydropteroate synthase-like protein [Palaeococcus pacificus]AIF69913.1 dihydropteroate synthase [Palaeococcus pacificus DY20341]